MRVLIAIGCNSYQHASQLAAAENDARRMFSALMRPTVGEYDAERSALLLSPSLEQVRSALRQALFAHPRPDTFTFFFAGHGGIGAGSLYMWVHDTSPNGQSMTALSLADLFRSINEASPRQNNIIIDACESGGLIEDLAVLLKPDLLGDAGTPSVTLIATSAMDQSAGETSAGGIGTNAILDCIEGRDFIQDSASVLDLVEIGRRVSARLQQSGQNPVVWGLNLYGPPAFCKNPCYGSDPSAPLRELTWNWSVDSDNAIRRNYESLWASYASLEGSWDQQRFAAVVNAVLDANTVDPTVLGGMAERLAATFQQKAAQSRDPFASVQVAATIAVSLLSSIATASTEESARRLLKNCCSALLTANASVIDGLAADRYALLSEGGGGVGDLYQLPLRVAKVLGWSAASTVMCQDESDRAIAEAQFRQIVRLVLDHYEPSIVALTDAQAPFWLLTLAQSAKCELRDEGEKIAGLLFHSLVHCSGNIGRWDLPPERAFEYLLARNANEYGGCIDLVERPLETLTVLLATSGLFNLAGVFDESLWKVDGLRFAAYIPSDYLQFGAASMEGGQNLNWCIGHDVFRTSDFLSTWPQATPKPATPLVAALAVSASLLYMERQAWFLLEDGSSGDERAPSDQPTLPAPNLPEQPRHADSH